MRAAIYAYLFALTSSLCVLTAKAQVQAPSEDETLPISVRSSETPELGPVTIERLEKPLGNAVVQDKQGFLWFASREGVYRFDGYEYEHYPHNPQDSTSLSQNYVETLYVDSEGTLWVGTYGGGLNRFNAHAETLTRYRHNPGAPMSLSQDTVTAIIEDSRGTLWVGTHGGLNRFDREMETFTRYRHDPGDSTSLSHDQVRVLYEDSRGTLWIGTGDPGGLEFDEGGLNRFDPATGTFTRYRHDPHDETSLIHNHVMSLFEDSRGTFWVGTSGDGLHTMDREAGTFTRHRYDPGDPTKISRPFSIRGTAESISMAEERCVGYGCGGVRFIHEDSQGMLWIGGFDGGINRYDLETGAMSHHEAATSGLENDNIWSMTESSDGTLWIATWRWTHKVTAATNHFPHVVPEPAPGDQPGIPSILSFAEEPNGTLWIGLRRGLDRLDPATGDLRHYREHSGPRSALLDDRVLSLYLDRAGAIWVGYWGHGGVSRYDHGSGRFRHFERDPDRPTNYGGDFTTAFLQDRQGTIWIASVTGLERYDPTTGTSRLYRHDPSEPASLGSNRVATLYEDESGSLWIGTENSLDRLDERAEQSAFEHFLPGHRVLDILLDSDGRFWVATGDGLHRIDRASGTSDRYGIEDGLPSSHVVGLVEDDEGYLWAATTKGGLFFPGDGLLSRFDPETETFVNFDPTDGLPEIGFMFNAVLKSRDGRLFLGGVGGYTVFDPAEIRVPVRHKPRTILTSLRVRNEEITPGPAAPIEAPLYEASQIRLSYDQNDVTIDYAALSFREPEKIRYHYMLENRDADWVNARGQHSARYSSLPPGEYVFRVRAVDSRGIESETASIAMMVLPPWWRTTWAYVLYGVLFVAGVVAVDRFQRRRLFRKERARAEREAEKLRTEAAEAWANYLQIENERKTQELEAARRLQLSMLPETEPEHPAVEIAASMETATEVGGDYYDFDISDDGTLTIAIGDATGHGTKAGTMVTATKSLWNAFSREDDLEQVLNKSTVALKRMGLPKLYMALALVRLRGHTLELVGAGLPPALHYRAATGEIGVVPLKGMPLGGPGRARYRRRYVDLSPGDTVMLMTDGFPELLIERGVRVGYDRAAEVFAEAADRSPQEIILHFEEKVRAWCDGNPPGDDVTFVVMKMKAGDERKNGTAA